MLQRESGMRSLGIGFSEIIYHEGPVGNVENVWNQRSGLLPEPVHDDEEDLDAAFAHPHSTRRLRRPALARRTCAQAKAGWGNGLRKPAQGVAGWRESASGGCEEVAGPHLQRIRLLD